MRKENASPRVSGLFYKATVQAVLLFRSESWSVTPASLKSLEGFHIRAARRMTGMMPTKAPGGPWEYPDSEAVLETAGLFTINQYIGVRRRTILKFVEQRPIFDLCKEAERQRGSGNRRFWWEQSMDLEGTSPATATVADSVGFDGV